MRRKKYYIPVHSLSSAVFKKNYSTQKIKEMAKANYTYQIKEFAGRNCLFIVDQDAGGRSVTNDIENVVKEIAGREKIDPAAHMIVYQDSDGNWDGWDHTTQSFVPLQCENQYHAVRRYIKQLESNVTNSHNNKNKTTMAKKVVTQQDLDDNPELIDAGAVLGEPFDFPDAEASKEEEQGQDEE